MFDIVQTALLWKSPESCLWHCICTAISEWHGTRRSEMWFSHVASASRSSRGWTRQTSYCVDIRLQPSCGYIRGYCAVAFAN